MKQRIRLFLPIFLILALLVSCGGKKEPDPTELAPKDFVLSGLRLTLTEGFESDREGELEILRSSTIAVFVDRVDFSTMAGAAELPLLTFAQDHGNAVETDGLILIEYTSSGATGSSYTYFTAFFKGESAFLTLQFACRTELYPLYRPIFIAWAKNAVPTV
jgi:hypothetical protein